MLTTSPTYTQLLEAQICASKPLLCTIGGGYSTGLIISDYSDFYSPAAIVRKDGGGRAFYCSPLRLPQGGEARTIEISKTRKYNLIIHNLKTTKAK